MTTRIDLSRLSRPGIPGLVLTLDEAHAALLRWLLDEHGWVLQEDAGDPAWRLTRLIAGRDVLLRQAVADAMAETSLAYATGARLDHIGVTYYSIVRLAGETDERYRTRLADAVERYAVGLSGPWYESVARGVAGVRDARIVTPAPGHVTLYVLADGALLDDAGDVRYPDGIPDRALLDAVTTAVTAPETRQQTDVVTVTPCTRARYDVTARLVLHAEPDSAAVLAAARAALARLADQLAHLGGSVEPELVIAACVDVAAVRSATVVLAAVGDDGGTTPIERLAPSDSVAPLARTLTVAA